MTDISTINYKYREWCEKVSDAALNDELQSMSENEKSDAFFRDLEFGTAGLRGVMGAGTNRMNIYTVAKATFGFAEFLMKKGAKSICVGYDSRINSLLFAQVCAGVLAECGLKTVYIARDVTPTPFLSYLVRAYKADGGIMITASHNPKEYNGYKIYGADGCQMNSVDSLTVSALSENADMFSLDVDWYKKHLDKKTVVGVENSYYEEYIQACVKQSRNRISGISITYTALNGAGYKAVPHALTLAGATNIVLVEEQSYPNGNFLTCPSPNPERDDACALGLKYAKRNESDIMIATDPDADRVVISVKHKEEYVKFNGNEMGILLTNYLTECGNAKGMYIFKSIVSTDLVKSIAKKHGAEVVDFLIGFRYFGEAIAELEKKGLENKFLLGFEESCGFLVGSHARDKDAIVASVIFAEMCSYYKVKGKTLVDVLNDVYSEHGKVSHALLSKEFSGADGLRKMNAYIASLRCGYALQGLDVTSCIDLSVENSLNLPRANILIYAIGNDAKLIIRPSGTEPLLKFYLSAKGTEKEIQSVFDEIKEYINNAVG